MTEPEATGDSIRFPVETFSYTAGSYDRLKSNEGRIALILAQI